jgi:HEAT repeat protein
VRGKAFRALRDLGTDVPLAVVIDAALARLAEYGPEYLSPLRLWFAPTLRGVAIGERDANLLISLLAGSDRDHRWLAARILRFIELQAQVDLVVPLLAEQINDPQPVLSGDAWRALEAIGAPAATPSVISCLLSAIESPSLNRGQVAELIEVLGTLGRFAPGEAIMQALESRLSAGDAIVRIQAIRAFGQIGHGGSQEHVSHRLRELARQDDDSRKAAVEALGALHAGAPDAEVLALIVERMDDLDETMRRIAAEAFLTAGGPEARVFDSATGSPRIVLTRAY